MSTEDLVSRVQKSFVRVFGPQIHFDPALSRLNEPRWTSLRHVEFMIALELEFGIRFDGADATDMTSMELVLERVRQRLG